MVLVMVYKVVGFLLLKVHVKNMSPIIVGEDKYLKFVTQIRFNK
jgi:hypothetical protein